MAVYCVEAVVTASYDVSIRVEAQNADAAKAMLSTKGSGPIDMLDLSRHISEQILSQIDEPDYEFEILPVSAKKSRLIGDN